MTNLLQRQDSYGSVIAQAAGARQYGSDLLMLLGGSFSARMSYSSGGLFARVVDMPAETCVSRGFTVEGAEEDLQSELDRLDVNAVLADALRWSILDGGAAILVLTRDGRDLSEEINIATLQEIEEFRVVSIVDMKANAETYTDTQRTNYGEPITYQVTYRSGAPVRVHESRLIPVPGAPTAWMQGSDMSRIPWAGRPLGPRAVEAIDRYRRGLRWAEKLLERSQQAVHKMKGLASMLIAKQESVIRARIDLVDSNRSAINGVAIDGEDDYTITTAVLTGVKDVLEQMQVACSAEIGIPITIVFGRSPGGLNATGDSDWATFYELCGQLQTRRLARPVERMVALIYAQTAAGLVAPENWKVRWNPLAVLTEQQQSEKANKEADTLKKIADAVKVAVDSTALSQDEAHAFFTEERLFGLQPEEDGQGGSGAAGYAGSLD